MTAHLSPTARHRRLIFELKRLREGRGLSRGEVAERLGTSETTVFRYEKGQHRPKPADVAALLDIYGVTDRAVREELLEMAKDARKRGWWHRYRRTLKPGFDSYIGLEAAASVIRTYQPQVVPGLLQTADYARAVIEETAMNFTPTEVDEKVEVRLSRQGLIQREVDPVQFIAVLDEAVLRRLVGGPDTMRAQLRHLAEVSKRPNVEVRVIPFSAGAHAAMDGPFCLLGFPETDAPDLVYLEQSISALVPEDPEEVRHYTLIFGNVLAKAHSAVESVAFIKAIADNVP
ncbi:helix-turn-helix domain-containing protein [Actinomadura rupiterrae]|uniref:helix-turn-helix domain-containing protein n=1 Tax=Actinomadura rupiterrae TaxID=559627 RepID=UPI0020A48E13|nr:helix-turn-helix transcriptional regulator [Actinomadura rupiterrae]MCP2337522.1 transcriptional regulator with XRE-family HTH domain [Actinomadura rupiterrae]